MKRIYDIYKKLEASYPRLTKWGRFFISGGIGAAVNISVLFLLTHVADLWYILSSIVAFIISICASFVLQKFWTFKDNGTDMVRLQATWYALLALINLGLNTALIYSFVDGLGFHYIVGQICTSILIAVESYLVYRKIFAHAILQQ